MKSLNNFQQEFMETLAGIQEVCVQTALCQNYDAALEERFYQITSEVIIRIMEMIDGYSDSEIGRLKVIWEENGQNLKENPCIELHDEVCAFLKGTE